MSRQGEKREASLKNIKLFWENEANEWGEQPQVTIRDHYFRLHEIFVLLSLIPKCKNLLDVGCGTGFGTFFFSNKADMTLGIDYAENMIKWANKFLEDKAYRDEILDKYSFLGKIQINNALKFSVGDLLNLELKSIYFDVITGQRILINLPTHQYQMKALENLRNYVKKDAILIMTESTIQGHQRTDKFRKKFGLSVLEKYWHNNYVDESNYNEWEKHGWTIQFILHFDTYMLLSKVIYPAACGENNCVFLSGVNKASMEMANLFRSRESVEEIGYDKFFKLFVERVNTYDSIKAKAIESWILKNERNLSNWKGLGHQQLIVAKAN